jgi:hypothetical protein
MILVSSRPKDVGRNVNSPFLRLNRQLFQSKIHLNRHHDGYGMPVLHSRFETVGLDGIDRGLVESVAERFENARVLRGSGGVDNDGNKNDPFDFFLSCLKRVLGLWRRCGNRRSDGARWFR